MMTKPRISGGSSLESSDPPTPPTTVGLSSPRWGTRSLKAAIAFAGSDKRVFTFDVAGESRVAKPAARGQVLLLLNLIQRRPKRQISMIRPIGRLLRAPAGPEVTAMLTQRRVCSPPDRRGWTPFEHEPTLSARQAARRVRALK